MKYQYPVYVQVVFVQLSNGAAVKNQYTESPFLTNYFEEDISLNSQHKERTNKNLKRKKKWHEPILPGLKPRFVEEIMERLPVIEDLVAVMDDVRGGTHVAEASEHQQWQKPT